MTDEHEVRLREAVEEALIDYGVGQYRYGADQQHHVRPPSNSEAISRHAAALDALLRYVAVRAQSEMPCLRTSWGKGAGADTGLTCRNLQEREPTAIVHVCPSCKTQAELDALRAEGA